MRWSSGFLIYTLFIHPAPLAVVYRPAPGELNSKRGILTGSIKFLPVSPATTGHAIYVGLTSIL
jgi:hypothetical protein